MEVTVTFLEKRGQRTGKGELNVLNVQLKDTAKIRGKRFW